MTGEICNGFLPSSLSSPAVTTIVTCNKKKEKRRQLILNHFFFFFKYALGLPLFRSISSVGLFYFVSPSSLFQVAGGKEELSKKGRRCWGKEQRWLALLLLVCGRYCWGDRKGRRSVKMGRAPLVSVKAEWVGACEGWDTASYVCNTDKENKVHTVSFWWLNVCHTGFNIFGERLTLDEAMIEDETTQEGTRIGSGCATD